MLDSATGVGVAFSPNSQFLFVSSTKYVYQFDVTATNIPYRKLPLLFGMDFILQILHWQPCSIFSSLHRMGKYILEQATALYTFT
ncbi:MAG: hypothetical protein IPG39_14435 [Bacteroidetes bacterium]|nr:hypothetical protein [Bacteroidota bacterium]